MAEVQKQNDEIIYIKLKLCVEQICRIYFTNICIYRNHGMIMALISYGWKHPNMLFVKLKKVYFNPK